MKNITGMAPKCKGLAKVFEILEKTNIEYRTRNKKEINNSET